MQTKLKRFGEGLVWREEKVFLEGTALNETYVSMEWDDDHLVHCFFFCEIGSIKSVYLS